MYSWFARIGFKVALVLFAALFLAYVVVNFQPYHFVENQIVARIGGTGLIHRLGVYGETASAWREKIGPGVVAARLIRVAENSPLDPSSIIAEMSGVPQVEDLLVLLSELSDTLIRLDDTLKDIAPSMQMSAGLARLQEPGYLGKEDMAGVMGDMQKIINGLNNASVMLAQTSQQITEVNSSLDGLRSSINILDAIAKYLDAWRGLPDTLDEIEHVIENDRQELLVIMSWYQMAMIADGLLNQLGIIALANKVVAMQGLLFSGMALGVGASVAGWMGSFSITHLRWRSLTHQHTPIYFSHPAVVDRRADPKDVSAVAEVPSGRRGISAMQTPSRPAGLGLLCLWPNGSQTVVALSGRDRLSIGCTPGDDIRLGSENTQVAQVWIKKAHKSYYLESGGGAYVNGRPIFRACSLRLGDKLLLGNVIFQVIDMQ